MSIHTNEKVADFIKKNRDNRIVKQLFEASIQQDRATFAALLKQIEAHLFATDAIPELRKCNCIDCLCEIEELKRNCIK